VPIDRSRSNAYFNRMSKLEIIKIPDPILRETSASVETVDENVRRLMDDMLETMYDAPGVGLAAIQVGIPKRVIVLDVAGDEDEPQPLFMANPKIVRLGEPMRMHEEGCLSIPSVHVEIERPAEVTVQYVDRDGAEQELVADDLLATAVQHEIDHLDGKLIIDFLSRLKRDIIIRKFKKQQRPASV
jgi:peptide deformylase